VTNTKEWIQVNSDLHTFKVDTVTLQVQGTANVGVSNKNMRIHKTGSRICTFSAWTIDHR